MKLATFQQFTANSAVTTSRRLVGQLRVQFHPVADPQHPGAGVWVIHDATGPRCIVFCTNMTALRDWLDNRPLALRDLDTAAEAEYMGKRVMRVIGESKTSGYFGARSVLPDEGIAALPGYAAACRERGLRLQLTAGHQWTSINEQLAFERAWMEAVHANGLDDVLALVEINNEWWQNDWLRWDHEQAIAQGKAIRDLGRQILNPCPLFAMGAPQDESPNLIYESSVLEGNLCEIHTERAFDSMIKHVFGTWYMEGNPGALVLSDADGVTHIVHGVAYWYGEPTPIAGGPDDFAPTTNFGKQVGEFGMQKLCSPAMTYFDGWDVRSAEPLDADAPTFWTIPQFLKAIPDMACLWPPVHGGSIWHWGEPDTKRFVTILDEAWYAGYRPPKPIATWTAYGPFNQTIGPKPGPVALPQGFGGAIIVGAFA